MILVDTSVWIDYFRRGSRHLTAMLDSNQVLMHPSVLGELACENLADRSAILGLLAALPAAPLVEVPLWTREKHLSAIAKRIGRNYDGAA